MPDGQNSETPQSTSSPTLPKRQVRAVIRRVVLAGVGLAALAGAGVFGWDWWTRGRFMEATDDAYVQGDITVIAPRVEGYVASVAVGDNQTVRAGDVLLTIDPADYGARVAQAEASVQAQRAAIATIEQRLALTAPAIAQAEAALRSADAEAARAAQDNRRYAELAQAQYAATQRFESARAAAAQASANVDAMRASVAAQRGQVGLLEAQRQEAQAALAQAEANLRLARINLDDTTIRAPVDGVIGNRTARVGQYVRAGTQAMVVVPVPDVYIVANFKETQIRHMRPGQLVTVTVDALGGRPLEGRIDSFAPGSGSQFSLLPPENATGNFTRIVQRVPVKIRLTSGSETRAELVPGLSVVARVDTRTGPPSTNIASAPAGAPR
jgi:membrane fusion protein (multidrug efflux system)